MLGRCCVRCRPPAAAEPCGCRSVGAARPPLLESGSLPGEHRQLADPAFSGESGLAAPPVVPESAAPVEPLHGATEATAPAVASARGLRTAKATQASNPSGAHLELGSRGPFSPRTAEWGAAGEGRHSLPRAVHASCRSSRSAFAGSVNRPLTRAQPSAELPCESPAKVSPRLCPSQEQESKESPKTRSGVPPIRSVDGRMPARRRPCPPYSMAEPQRSRAESHSRTPPAQQFAAQWPCG